METNPNFLPKAKYAQVHWLVKEVIAWILVVNLFIALLTYLYVWPYVVLTSLQIAALWITGDYLR